MLALTLNHAGLQFWIDLAANYFDLFDSGIDCTFTNSSNSTATDVLNADKKLFLPTPSGQGCTSHKACRVMV